jgi:ABC-type branched-subunit amino acid transport system substrate-binding protein
VAAGDVQEARPDAGDYADLVRDVAAARPDAVLYTGLGDDGGRRVLAALARALPHAALYGTGALASGAAPGAPPAVLVKAAAPPAAYGAGAVRLMRRLRGRLGSPVEPEALYGYAAMRLVLDALEASPLRRDLRPAVRAAGIRPRSLRTVLGRLRLGPTGDVTPARLAEYRQARGRLRFLGLRPAGPPSP